MSKIVGYFCTIKHFAYQGSRRSIATRNMYANEFGFTIVELLIVVVVIAILAAVALVSYNGITIQARESAAQTAARQAYTKIFTYAATHGEDYPVNLSDAGISSSATTFEYSVEGDPGVKSFCVTATIGDTHYFISSTTTVPTKGLCPGHNGGVEASFDQPDNCPTGFVPVPGISSLGTSGGFCVMKYEAKSIGSVTTSQAAGAPWTSITQTDAFSRGEAACSGCHLITEAEWMTIVANILTVPDNWSGGSVGSGYVYQGHNNSSPAAALEASGSDQDGLFGITGGTGGAGMNNRRTLRMTNGEVLWDFAGNVGEWTQGALTGMQPGFSGESAFNWKQWNNPSILWGSLMIDSRPSKLSSVPGLANIGNWSSNEGIGQLFSSRGATGTRAFIRGGTWTSGNNGGVLMVVASNDPSFPAATVGFRVAR